MSSRPKRTTRQSTKAQEVSSSPVASGSTAKTKPKAKEAELNVQYLLQNPKSQLTRMDIADILNAEVWTMLSPESQAILSTLLPPTAFHEYKSYVDSTHPKGSSSTQSSSSGVLDLAVFKDSHFNSAARTFQDHIFSGWKTETQAGKVQRYLDGIRDGSLSAPYKDEVWEKDNGVLVPIPRTSTSKTSGVNDSVASARAGQAADVKLSDMVAAAVLKVGDVISYKRYFSGLDVVVEKDAVIQSLNPRTRAVTVLLPSGTTQYLPADLLSRTPGDADESIRSTTPNGNAWKTLTVWRWREDDAAESVDERWGRESHGTLFYIRGCFYHDR
ncbi:Asx homology domain-containing protein [Mucidula mucida]|nr:Asx homology domain-containing protein [Mucidula mucida]